MIQAVVKFLAFSYRTFVAAALAWTRTLSLPVSTISPRAFRAGDPLSPLRGKRIHEGD